MRYRRRWAALALAAGLALPSPTPARASGDVERLTSARAAETSARRDLARLLAEYRRQALAADDAIVRSLQTRMIAEQAIADESLSRARLDARVRDAYINGLRAADLVFGSASMADLEARLPYASRSLALSQDDVRRLARDRAHVASLIAQADSVESEIISHEQALIDVRQIIESRLDAARVEVAGIEAALAAQALSELSQEWDATRALVQSAIEARRRQRGERAYAEARVFLGPRPDCSAPSGLRATGQTLHGEASWYGNEFAGENTATGAVFDPGRYTVAHRSLPFGVFMLIRSNGRCVMTFLNDRGPYVGERILDLSGQSAKVIGLSGVEVVDATIYVPA